MHAVKLTVGIPFCNNGQTLAAAIRSVFAQSFRDWDLLLVDDGSTDGSLAIARSVRDPRVSVVSDGLNRGLACRLNQIAQSARGAYLARMDADDLMHPERLALQVRALDEDPQLDVLDTAVYAMDGSGRPIGVRGVAPLNTSPAAVLRQGLLHHPTVAGRTAWFRRNPCDRELLRAQDYELWCRTLHDSTFGRIARPLHFYREGRVAVAKYLESGRAFRRIAERYGHALAGAWTTRGLLLKSHLKDCVYRAAAAVGAQGWLARRRNRRLNAIETAAALQTLRQILGTPVPGLVEPAAPAAEPGAIKLVHVTTIPESLGFLEGHAGFLRGRGIAVEGISSPGAALDRFARREHAAVHPLAMSRRIAPLRDLVSLWRLYRALRRIRPHIVHAHTPKAGLLGMLAAWLARVPVRVYTIHGLPLMTARGWKRRLLRRTERIACRLAHWVQAVSGSLRNAVTGESLCPAEKIGVLLGGSINGVDAQRRFNPYKWGARARRAVRIGFDIPADGLVLGYAGRIVRDKGMAELADAWRVLRGQFADLHLLLLGPFEPQDPVPADVELLFRHDRRIHLAGTVQDPAPYYAAMDLCVLPSYREGLPAAALEAAAMRLPVVATRIAGCVDAVLDGATGTLVPPRDAAALTAAIAAYLRDPALRRNHGAAGRQRVLEAFQPRALWEALYQQYAQLLQEKGLAVPASFVPCPSAHSENAPERRAA